MEPWRAPMSGNPDLNQSRANVRARDEDAPKALAGMRPKASISANAGPEFADRQNSRWAQHLRAPRAYLNDEFLGKPRGAAFNVSQTLYDGGRTANSVRQAESSVLSARASLRQTEQTILQNGRDRLYECAARYGHSTLRKSNVAVLDRAVAPTRDRFQVGEVTRTDVAQAEASLAQANSDFFAAQALLKISVAGYRQVVGVEPKRLEPAQGVEMLLPKSLPAIAEALAANIPIHRRASIRSTRRSSR